MKTLICFDAAGTLIDHAWDSAQLAFDSACEIGLNLSKDSAKASYTEIEFSRSLLRMEVEKRRDPAEITSFWQETLSLWLIRIGQDPMRAREILELSRRAIYSQNNRIWKLYPDVIPALDFCCEQGAAIGVVSNWDHSLHRVLKLLGIYERFSFVIASLEFGVEKPDRRIFEEALRLGNASAADSMHVGDSYEDDVVGARNAGLRALFLDRSSIADLSNGRIQSLTEIEGVLCA